MPDCFSLILVASIALLLAGTMMRAPVVVRALVFLGSVLYIAGLVLTDISYTVVDPRVRLS